jgi:uncharacterized protein (TIGR03000 family)
MSMRLVKLIAPAVLFLAPTSAPAQHHGGGHSGGHAGSYHGGYHSGYSGYHSGYYGGYGGYRGYGYGGYGGYGYPLLGYGLGYGGYGYPFLGFGLGYRGLGYGGYGGYGYSSPYYSGYTYPNTSDWYYPTATPPVIGGVVQASATDRDVPVATSATAAPATITAIVPNGAQLWFNGKETAATGTSRVFTSPTLQPDQQPAVLEIKARWDGNMHSMQLPMHAGDKVTVDLR